MSKTILVALGAAALAACSSYPAPTQRMADAVATSRAATEVGANTNPQAQLHVRLANEEIERARRLMDDGDNKRADFLLVRAKADADLALAQARESAAESSARAAMARADELQNKLHEVQAQAQATPTNQSANMQPSTDQPANTPAGTTTTTGATVPGPLPLPPPVVHPSGAGGVK